MAQEAAEWQLAEDATFCLTRTPSFLIKVTCTLLKRGISQLSEQSPRFLINDSIKD